MNAHWQRIFWNSWVILDFFLTVFVFCTTFCYVCIQEHPCKKLLISAIYQIAEIQHPLKKFMSTSCQLTDHKIGAYIQGRDKYHRGMMACLQLMKEKKWFQPDPNDPRFYFISEQVFEFLTNSSTEYNDFFLGLLSPGLFKFCFFHHNSVLVL